MTDGIELTERQRKRLDQIKAECSDDSLPEPTDEQILKSLMDTWDAVSDGYYSEPEWNETPVTLNVIEDILEAHPDYTLTSHHGPEERRYVMLQFFDEEPNHQANADFVSFVSELDTCSTDTGTDRSGGRER